MTDRSVRGDPDALLPRASAAARREPRARFKIFFGFAPGGGTTRRMLQVARDLAAEGVDVVVGAVEPHGRGDAAGPLHGLEVLPRRSLPGRGGMVEEFDLDAALARRPRILLLDELAHTNAPGARRARRWQDAAELLDAGIEVYATLDVRHVESLSDVVEQITRAPVRETVPDAVLERADEVEVVDVAPEELLARLRGGEVHRPEEAEHAREHLFRRGTLLALRELAVRRIADRVDADVLAYRAEHGVDVPRATAERVLVCVGPSPDSERVIRAGRRVAAELRAPWIAATVDATVRATFADEERARVEAHLRLAESLGAEVARLSGVRVAPALLELARRRGVTRIVLGKPRRARWRDRLGASVVDEVVRGSGDVEVRVLAGDAEPDRERRPAAPAGRTSPRDLLVAFGVVAATTGIAAGAHVLLAMPDVDLLYLLGVMVAALVTGRRASILAGALAVLSYDFFFVPPAFTLWVADARYYLTFAMMFGVSVVIGTLTLRLREQRRAALRRERSASALYALSRELGAALDAEGVAAVCVKAAIEAFAREAVFLRVRGPDALEPLAAAPPGAALSAAELAVARWAVGHGRPAGHGTDALAREPVLCIPVRASGDPVAVLAVRTADDRSDPRALLDSLARQAAIALDRVRLADEAREAALHARTEELRSGLLSSVSHDLRTPLATITGSASTLRDAPDLPARARRDLLDAICEEAERLERLVSSLLDMTRLDSGAVEPRREWVPIEEVVGGALTRLERRLAGHAVATRLPRDLPLASLDPVLVEQLFVNLLENAAKYAPPASPIEIRASQRGGTILVEISDRGPGIPPGHEERIFERFYRGDHPGVRGAGLGLPIARAIAQVHGGRLAASSRRGGGAVFRLTLPIGTEPPRVPAEGGTP